MKKIKIFVISGLLMLTAFSVQAQEQAQKQKQKSVYANITIKSLEKDPILQNFGDSTVHMNESLKKAIKKQININSNYAYYVVEFWNVLQKKKILNEDLNPEDKGYVSVDEFKEGYLFKVNLFREAILPEYTAIKPHDGIRADHINTSSDFKLSAEIDKTFYSLNTFKSKPGKLFLIEWYLGLVKNGGIDQDGDSSIDIKLVCENGICVDTKHVFRGPAGSEGLTISQFLKARFSAANPKDPSFWRGRYKSSPVIGAIGKIIATIKEP